MKHLARLFQFIPLVMVLLLVGCGSNNTPNPTPPPGPWKASWVSPNPQGNTLHGVWAVSDRSFYAVGNQGTILHSDGTTWRVMESPVRLSLYGVWGSSDTNVYAVGEEGLILHYDGTRWQIVMQPSGSYADTLMSLWGMSDNLIFAGGRGRALKYDGIQWRETDTSGLAGDYVYGLWGTDDSNLYAAGSGLIYHYNGSSWQKVYEDTSQHAIVFTSIWGSAANDIYVGMKMLAGDEELEYVMMHFNGTAWEPIMDSAFYSGSYIYTVTGTGWNDVYALGLQSNIYHFDGTSWRWMLGGAQISINSASAPPSGMVVAVGELGVLYRYDGTEWNFERDEFFTSLVGSWSSVNKAYLSAYKSIFVFDGSQLTPQVLPTTKDIDYIGLWGFSDAAVFAVGNYATDDDDSARIVLQYDGSTWRELLNEVGEPLRSIWGTGPTNLYAVGFHGTILHYDGTTWNSMESPVTSNLRRIWGTAANNIYAVGDEGTLIKFDGNAWSQVLLELSEPLLSVSGTGPDNILVVGKSTVLYYNGSRWRTVESGTKAMYNDVVWINPTSALIVGFDGIVVAWDGMSLTPADQITHFTLHSTFMLGGHPYALGNYGTVLKFTR